MSQSKRDRIKKLEFYLGMLHYRKASMYPGPGIEEDERKVIKEINKLKKTIKDK